MHEIGYGKGDLGEFDPIAANLVDGIGLAEGEENRAKAITAYHNYIASRDAGSIGDVGDVISHQSPEVVGDVIASAYERSNITV